MPHILLGIVICAQTGCTTWNILFSVLRLQKGHHQWMIRSSAHPLFNPGPTPQGSLESKRDPGTWNWTQCAGPPPVDDPLISSPTVQPRTHPPRVLWNPKEIQAPGMVLDVLAHHQRMMITRSPTVPPSSGLCIHYSFRRTNRSAGDQRWFD
jgi:hypothetical protein